MKLWHPSKYGCLRLWHPSMYGYIKRWQPHQCAANIKRHARCSTCGLHQTLGDRSIYGLHQTVGARLPAKWPANLTHFYRPHRRVRGQARSHNDGWQPAMCGMHKTVAPIDVWVSQTVAPIDYGYIKLWQPHRCAANIKRHARRSTCGLHRTVGAGLLAKALCQVTGPVVTRQVRQQAGSYSLSRSSTGTRFPARLTTTRKR